MNDLSHAGVLCGTVATITEFKFSKDAPEGTFEGYGAVYGNMDRGGDIIEHGACAKFLNEIAVKGWGLPPMYYNHDRTKGTYGVWESMSEDSQGLNVKGRLIALDTEQGKITRARVESGAMKGMSIGYRIPAGGYKRGSGKGGEPLRWLKQISLSEVSLVDDPMNPSAKFTFMKNAAGMLDDLLKAEDIKSADDLADFIIQNIHHIAPAIATRGWKDAIREFEGTLLRDVGGFSNGMAKSIAVAGFKSGSDSRDENEALVAVLDRISNFKFSR